jgi:AcrR family transcriptional regulator
VGHSGDVMGGAREKIGDTALSAARPGIRDAQTAAVLGALSPTARRIVKAAFRVLERDGYEGLSLRRIAQEAGETKSLITYHFENKAGLVTTLVDSLWHDADVSLAAEAESLAADPRGRLLALTGLHRRLAQDARLYQTYFDLFPHILRDGEARARLTRTYRSYRHIGELCLAQGSADGNALSLATLLLAIGEGIAVQVLMTGDGGVLKPAFAVLERRVLCHLGLEPAAEPPRAPVAQPVPGSPSDAADPSAGFLEGMEDPAARLTPAAARVLDAAVALASDEGLRAVTAESLARVSGEPSSSVLYYFGDKRGLIASVVAASDYRFAQAVTKAAGRVASYRPAPAALAGVVQRVFQQPGWMRLFYDVLPVVLRDDDLRAREAVFMERLRSEPTALLCRAGIDEDESWLLALLSQSLVFGLAVQKLVDPRGPPVSAAVEAWRALLEQRPVGPREPSGKA